jgi:hypothetical protein
MIALSVSWDALANNKMKDMVIKLQKGRKESEKQKAKRIKAKVTW